MLKLSWKRYIGTGNSNDKKINKQPGRGPADEKESGDNGIMQEKRKVKSKHERVIQMTTITRVTREWAKQVKRNQKEK